MSESFILGQTVRVKAKIRDPETKLPVDVNTPVTVTFKSPSNALTTVSATRTGTGHYFARIEPGEAGLWHFRMESVAPDVAIGEGEFLVEPSAVL